jgi:hypothetical protein
MVSGNLEISNSSELELLCPIYFGLWLFIRLLPEAFVSPPLGKITEPDSSYSSRHTAEAHVRYPILRQYAVPHLGHN